MLSQGGILEDKLLKEILDRLFSYKVKNSIIPSKCGSSFYFLHCSEVFLTECNYIQAKQTCKQLCLNYTCKNHKSTNNPQVSLKQYDQFYFCELRWIFMHLCGKKKVLYLWNTFGNTWESRFFMFYMFMCIFHMFYSVKHLSKDFWVKWPHLLFVN